MSEPSMLSGRWEIECSFGSSTRFFRIFEPNGYEPHNQEYEIDKWIDRVCMINYLKRTLRGSDSAVTHERESHQNRRGETDTRKLKKERNIFFCF